MARSLKKGPYVDERLLKKIKNFKPGSDQIIKTWSRSSTISPEMIGFTFAVHNGKNFIPVKVNEDMVGHRLGEFVPTTRFSRHGGKMQRGLEARVAQTEQQKAAASVTKTPDTKTSTTKAPAAK
ncbi:MAG: 30S ribosomal protein S19 [Patescibacteria group bacterium]|nr:30S ribosomal protein S19 [Patescibacteria group bacterium]